MNALSIHLTDICNSRCIFCVVNSPSQKKDWIKRERVDQFLVDNSGQGYDAVNLHGGEPTTRRDFIEILEKIQSLGYPAVVLQTNGRKLAHPEFAKQVVDRGVSLFVVSLHGRNAETQDFISGVPKSFEGAVAGIRNVKALGQKVRTNTVVCQQNYKDLPNIISFIVDLGVDHINISALHPAGMAYKNFHEVSTTYAEARQYIFEAVERAVAAGTKITLEGFPFCAIPGYSKYVIDWGAEKFKMLFRSFVLEDYAAYMDDCARVKDVRCQTCACNQTCGGVYKEYIEFNGWGDEFVPVAGEG